jgi:hypothetical protein
MVLSEDLLSVSTALARDAAKPWPTQTSHSRATVTAVHRATPSRSHVLRRTTGPAVALRWHTLPAISFGGAQLKKLGVFSVLAIGASIAFLTSCGGGSPADPNPPVTPTPTASGPKTPAPVGSVTCALGNGSPTASCSRLRSELVADVDAAIQAVVTSNPEIFDMTQEASPNTRQYLVVDKSAFLAHVLDNLRAAGLCADLDYTTLEIVQVKRANHVSEDFDLINNKGFLKWGISGAYQKSCNPASFPVTPDAEAPPPGSGCGRPYPPEITRFGAKIHVRNSDYWTLDSTPRVGPDVEYCASIGYKDGRSFCALRAEGADDRNACENWRVGLSKDRNSPGPTWTRDGAYCTGRASGCAHHPENPYQMLVYANGAGKYKVCAANGICGEVFVKR